MHNFLQLLQYAGKNTCIFASGSCHYNANVENARTKDTTFFLQFYLVTLTLLLPVVLVDWPIYKKQRVKVFYFIFLSGTTGILIGLF